MHALEQTSIIIQLEQYINSIIPYDEIDNIEKDVLEKLSKDKYILDRINEYFEDQNNINFTQLLDLTNNPILLNIITDYLEKNNKKEQETKDINYTIEYVYNEDVTKSYLKTISSIPLIETKEEEQRLFKKLEEIKSNIPKNQDPNESKEYVKLRDQLIERNLGLVVYFAKRFETRGMKLIDLIEEGNIGLIEAVDNFDPNRGFKFCTYAQYKINQRISRSLKQQPRIIRLPIGVEFELSDYKKIDNEIKNETRSSKSNYREIARRYLKTNNEEEIEKLAKRIKALFNISNVPVSIDEPTKNSINPLKDVIKDDVMTSPDEHLDQSMLVDIINNILDSDKINERNRKIFEMRNGLNGYEPHILKDLAEEFGITVERVRQINMRIEREFYKPKNIKKLDGYIDNKQQPIIKGKTKKLVKDNKKKED